MFGFPDDSDLSPRLYFVISLKEQHPDILFCAIGASPPPLPSHQLTDRTDRRGARGGPAATCTRCAASQRLRGSGGTRAT